MVGSALIWFNRGIWIGNYYWALTMCLALLYSVYIYILIHTSLWLRSYCKPHCVNVSSQAAENGNTSFHKVIQLMSGKNPKERNCLPREFFLRQQNCSWVFRHSPNCIVCSAMQKYRYSILKSLSVFQERRKALWEVALHDIATWCQYKTNTSFILENVEIRMIQQSYL